MTNESFPHLCKIGCVNIGNTSQSRALSLSSSTSVPFPFVVEFDIKVKNPYKYEKILHNIFDSFKYRFRKEFFKCNIDDIIKFFNYDEIYKYDNTADISDFSVDYLTIYNKNYINIIVSDSHYVHEDSDDIQNEISLNNKEVKTRLNINENPDIYNCVYCNKCFKSYNSLNNHYSLVHRDEHKQKRYEIINQSKIYKCHICNIILNSRTTKYRHILKCKEMIKKANEKLNNIQNIKNEPNINNKLDELIDLMTILKNTKFNNI
jgi:hypothetical protein